MPVPSKKGRAQQKGRDLTNDVPEDDKIQKSEKPESAIGLSGGGLSSLRKHSLLKEPPGSEAHVWVVAK